MKTFLPTILLAFCFLGWGKPHEAGDISKLAAEGSQNEGKSTIVFFRDASGALSAWDLNVKIDGTSHGSVRRKSYLRFDIEPGEHILTAAWPLLSGGANVAIKAQFMPNKTYYLTFGTSFGTGYKTYTFTSNLSQIDFDTATSLMNEYKERAVTQ